MAKENYMTLRYQNWDRDKGQITKKKTNLLRAQLDSLDAILDKSTSVGSASISVEQTDETKTSAGEQGCERITHFPYIDIIIKSINPDDFIQTANSVLNKMGIPSYATDICNAEFVNRMIFSPKGYVIMQSHKPSECNIYTVEPFISEESKKQQKINYHLSEAQRLKKELTGTNQPYSPNKPDTTIIDLLKRNYDNKRR